MGHWRRLENQQYFRCCWSAQYLGLRHSKLQCTQIANIDGLETYQLSRFGLGHLRLVPKTNFRPNCKGHIYKKNQLPRRWRSSEVIKSFKVTNFDTNRKPVSNFKVHNTKVHTVLYCFPVITQYLSNYRDSPLWKGCISLTHSFSIICLNNYLHRSSVVKKVRFIWGIWPFRRKDCGSIPSTTLMWAPSWL